jgi:hypothetical protein
MERKMAHTAAELIEVLAALPPDTRIFVEDMREGSLSPVSIRDGGLFSPSGLQMAEWAAEERAESGSIEDMEEFGRETGECGNCGHLLEPWAREAGLCGMCQDEAREDAWETLHNTDG